LSSLFQVKYSQTIADADRFYRPDATRMMSMVSVLRVFYCTSCNNWPLFIYRSLWFQYIS